MSPSDHQAPRLALGSRYELVEVIGAGAMGKVWRAWDRTDQAYRAAKVLREELTSDPEILTRFIQERSILIGLRHPNIVEVHDLVVEGNSLAIVMELIEGPGLRGYLRAQGTLAPAIALAVASSVLDALAAAHAAGTLHRDVKPDNILLAEGKESIAQAVKLTDFGIARLAQDSTVQATGLLGTPSYMPPELFERGITSAASDVYAVGIMLYEMLAGRTPFGGSGTAHTIGFRHLTALPPQLDVPAPLWSALDTMLAKDPRKRLSAAATAEHLRELMPQLEGLPAGPKLTEPDDWDRITGADGPVHREIRPQHLASSEDVGGTRLRGGGGKPAMVARAVDGEVQALIAGEGDADGMTNVHRAPVARAGAPTLTSTIEPQHSSRKPLYFSILGVVAVVAIVAGLLFGGVFSHHSGGGTPASSGPVSVSNTNTTSWANNSLSYTSSADYTPGSGLTLTLVFKYQFPVTGDLLVVVPAVGSQGTNSCADVTWQGSTATATSLANAASNWVPCGYDIAATGASSPTFTVTASVSTPSAPTSQQLTAWLQAIDTTTAAQVANYGGDKTHFILQEIAGFNVRVVRQGQTAGYLIMPSWAGSSGGGGGPLFTSGIGANPGNIAGPFAALLGLPNPNTSPNVPFAQLPPSRRFVSVNANGGGISSDGVLTPGAGGTMTVTVAGLTGEASF